ncbi:LysR family transcriptional regulator [Pectobacterium versatile]|uniref:LysR family transcriptional regulator n=1 Tax=Pectobacterium versatile TaxID=2488639 RepID=UPI000CDEF596|nr:LysR family transcriptional regulator [Pectobacterium versatile]POY59890.1 LysR family transcriptional regulator [Pectobacterium versatile]POY64638.1 LysR family transcriptional regulator [Pectobacterium versatile]TAI90463.1 LysR family transcriptional regulator [Pectobacterium versatile]TAJ06197.1 LysR family transcriptional regulator [Pectobacterium versatile]
MNRITALNIFRRVVELGTFKAAAEDLHLSQAAVSKNINELEDHLGTALINRTTRRMNVTESGLVYYRQICSVLDALESADQSVMASSFSPKGSLRVSAPMSYGLIKINPLICDFRHQYPDISTEVILSDTYVDLIDKGVDVAIRGGGVLNDSSMRSRLICKVRRVLCASPDYLSQAAPATHPDNLKEHDCLVYSLSSSPRKWIFTRGNESTSVDLMPANYSVNNGIALKQAAIKGLGIILIPEEFVRPELESGELVEVMPEWAPDTHSLYAVYPYHKEQSQKVRLFIDFVMAAFREIDKG